MSEDTGQFPNEKKWLSKIAKYFLSYEDTVQLPN